MRERIKKILEEKQLTQAAFADMIGVGRPSISHIMSGRDKFSQIVASNTLLTFPEINPTWLVNGIGEMYQEVPKKMGREIGINLKKEELMGNEIKNNTLFDAMPQEPALKESKQEEIPVPQPESKPVIKMERNKKIEKVVFFYNDQTFEEYYPKNQE